MNRLVTKVCKWHVTCTIDCNLKFLFRYPKTNKQDTIKPKVKSTFVGSCFVNLLHFHFSLIKYMVTTIKTKANKPAQIDLKNKFSCNRSF